MGLYLLIAAKDIQAAKRDALTHPDEWTRRLHARLILLTVIEWDMDAVTGRALKKALDTMKIPDELQREMTAALRRLRKIRERIEKDYTFVRNVAIAHRDPDVLAQYRAIRDLDTDKLYEITAEFFQAVDQFIVAHTKLLNASSTMASVLAQWAEYEKNGGATLP
jgi:nucleotide-binding universal stress UspA family protein